MFSMMFVMGWLMHPPQFTFTKNGSPICRFRIGCTNVSVSGEALFFTCLVQGGTKPYNLIRDYQFGTGDTVFISGPIQYRGMKKAQDGKMYPEISILVQSINAVSLLPKNQDSEYIPEIMDHQETKFNNKRETEMNEDNDLWGKTNG